MQANPSLVGLCPEGQMTAMIWIHPWLIYLFDQDQPRMILIVSMGLDHFNHLIDVVIDAIDHMR